LKFEDPQTRDSLGYYAADEVDRPVQEIWCVLLKAWQNSRVKDTGAGLALIPTGHTDKDFSYRGYRRLGLVTDMPLSWFADCSQEALTIV
jgi:hypothetical protein